MLLGRMFYLSAGLIILYISVDPVDLWYCLPLKFLVFFLI